MSLLREFEQLWKGTDDGLDRPDVVAFLNQHPVGDGDSLRDVLRFDQKCRWKTDSPLKVEDYLARLPDLPSGIDWKLQLAIGEFEARRDTDRPLSAEEVSSRFPDLSETLRERIRQAEVQGETSPAAPHESEATELVEVASGTVTYITSKAVGVDQKGRYRLDRVLGEGGFGRVYLGYDEELQRQVAIKVPTKERFQKPEDAEAYLAEARTVASLDHPHIVPVYDMGRTQDGSIYVVSKFIEGSTLDGRIKAGRMPERDAAELLATVALALQHAHQRRLVHRDIKPANILIEDSSNTPYVADFGLAVREEDYLKDTAVAGTPAYMSPEQARGEGHRLDGRSDIFSLGVILYELLTSQKPFRGSSPLETLQLVTTVDPRAPRELLASIPVELDRICLKALSKRASDRYATAADFATDLQEWLKPTTTAVQRKTSVTVVPRGLRSFGPEDADFFLDLLPGPRNREGLPESIAFWKQRIEETDPEKTFTVGLIYGPSGCGKSSLVKAGLLPHLSSHVVAIYVEATPDETETRILRGLRKRLPDLPQNLNLVETFTWLRREANQHVVVIIDQFEQWLHAHREERESELVAALRQCDGGRLQGVVMVRDDFAMAAARFMDSLDLPLVQGHNFVTVDLFDVEHAEQVLVKFGQAFGKLPAQSGKLTDDEQSFVRSAASGLAQDGKVISVRLALFSEMVKGKPWIPATLDEVGGTAGIGVNFLEETFSSRTANPKHRLHQQAAREVLKSLLPEVGSDIKGHMRSHSELLEASGYQSRPRDFADLLRILDGELRLITPTDPGGAQTESGSDLGSKYYQLTHDYLVPSLREWLTRKQQETRKGRAELKLAERAALWTAKPEARHLPSLLEWARIRTLTEKDKWTEPQQTMMRSAGRMHVLRTTAATALFVILIVAGFVIQSSVQEQQRELVAQQRVEGLLSANTTQVATSIESLKDYREWADPLLQEEYEEADDASDARLHAALALVTDTDEPDSQVLEFLSERLLTVKPAQFGAVRELLQPHQDKLVAVYWELALNDDETASRRFHAACALAAFDPDSERVPATNGEQTSGWNAPEFTTFVSEQLVAVEPVYVGLYQELLRPVSSELVPSLSAIFSDPERGELAKTLATSLLADYAVDQPDTLTDLVLVADPAADQTLFPVLAPHRAAALPQLHALLDERLLPDWQDQPLDPDWTEPSADIRARIETAHGQIAERFAFCQDMPWPEFLDVVESLRASGYRPTRIRPATSLLPLARGEGARRADEGVVVAAVWTRDTRRWQLQHGVTRDQLPASDEPAANDGLIPVDVAAIPANDPDAEPEFLILWAEPHGEDQQRRILADVSETELQSAAASLAKQGFAAQCTISVRNEASGERRYSGIWSNTGAPSELRPAYPGFELVWQPQWDLAVANAAPLSDPLEQFRRQLTQIAQLPAERQEEPGVRQARAIANYQLGNIDDAWMDLEVLLEQDMPSANVRQYAALTLARLGRADEATEALEQYLATEPPASFQSYLKVLVPAWLGDADPASAELDTAADALSDDLYNIACAAALCAQAFADGDADRSQGFADRTMELLQQLVAGGYDDAEQLRDDPDFAVLHDDPRFVVLLEQLEPPARVAAVWRADVEFESQLVSAAGPDELLKAVTPLLQDGWRPFAIALHVPSAPARGEGQGEGALNDLGDPAARNQASCQLILHRPLIPDAATEALAIRQAAAATTLLRLDAADRVWPLLQDQPDPRLQSNVLHRLALYEVDPQSLLDQLAMESDVSRQRSLIQGLGEFARERLLSEEQQAAAIAELSRRYAEAPDPGIHGMCEWTLRQLGADEAIAEVRSAYATGTTVGERQWYLTQEGQHTLMVVDGDEEFLMGSPVSEAERYGGPTGRNEILHRRRVGRTFAIASHEVTVAQFQAFRPDHDFDRTKAREENAPANMISWYDAAAYCNWLSEQEGLERDQWCYDPDQPFEEGMTLPPDYLDRTGYRLPSEAEWEFACRAGTTTARYYGETETLLGEYAWYSKTSGDQWMLPVGSLRPNAGGLFDVQGNVLEWCQDAALLYDTDEPLVGDSGQSAAWRKLDNSRSRVLRGGSFSYSARNVRSANRSSYRPSFRSNGFGFRVARTYR